MAKTWLHIRKLWAQPEAQEVRAILAQRARISNERMRKSLVKRCPSGYIICKGRLVEFE